MRGLPIIGSILIVLGILALFIRGFTYFTIERVIGPLGFFAWDTSQPHTIFIGPLAGIVALAIGIALLFMASGRSTA